MQRLIAELRLISKEVGDTGSDHDREALIQAFVHNLKLLFSPVALETFTAFELREVFAAYAANRSATCNSLHLIMSRFGIRLAESEARPIPSYQRAANVVSLR